MAKSGGSSGIRPITFENIGRLGVSANGPGDHVGLERPVGAFVLFPLSGVSAGQIAQRHQL